MVVWGMVFCCYREMIREGDEDPNGYNSGTSNRCLGTRKSTLMERQLEITRNRQNHNMESKISEIASGRMGIQLYDFLWW